MTRLRMPSLTAIVLIGLALRLALVLVLPQQPFSDGAWYVDRARGLVAGLGYQENGVATAFWPAGYPVLLAAVATLLPMKLAILLINFAAAAATLLLIARLGESVVGSERAGRIGALIYALYPAHIAYTGAPLAEGVSTALVLAGFALLVERPRVAGAVAAGLLFGLATTMRAQILYFPRRRDRRARDLAARPLVEAGTDRWAGRVYCDGRRDRPADSAQLPCDGVVRARFDQRRRRAAHRGERRRERRPSRLEPRALGQGGHPLRCPRDAPGRSRRAFP